MFDSFPQNLTYSFQILSSLMMLSMVFVMITLANESAHRIVECSERREQSEKSGRTCL